MSASISSATPAARGIAVVSDRRARRPERDIVSAATIGDAAASRYATEIERLTGIPTRRFACDPAPDSPALVRQLLRLREQAPEIAVIVLTRPPRQARGAPLRMIPGVPVVTVDDAMAVGVAAATVTALNRAGRAPARGSVVIAGARALPVLCPLLIGVGVGDITSWNLEDATACSLMSVAGHSHVVVNLLAREPGLPSVCGAHADPVVITPDPVGDPLRVLPGLARALFEMPATEHGTYRDRYDDLLLACVFALVMATPPLRPRPPRPDRELTARIADAPPHPLVGSPSQTQLSGHRPPHRVSRDTTPRGASTT